MEQKVEVQSADKVKIQRPKKNQKNNDYSPRSRIYVRSVKGALEAAMVGEKLVP